RILDADVAVAELARRADVEELRQGMERERERAAPAERVAKAEADRDDDAGQRRAYAELGDIGPDAAVAQARRRAGGDPLERQLVRDDPVERIEVLVDVVDLGERVVRADGERPLEVRQQARAVVGRA